MRAVAAQMLPQGHLGSADHDRREPREQRRAAVRDAAIEPDDRADRADEDQQLRQWQRMPRRLRALADRLRVAKARRRRGLRLRPGAAALLGRVGRPRGRAAELLRSARGAAPRLGFARPRGGGGRAAPTLARALRAPLVAIRHDAFASGCRAGVRCCALTSIVPPMLGFHGAHEPQQTAGIERRARVGAARGARGRGPAPACARRRRDSRERARGTVSGG